MKQKKILSLLPLLLVSFFGMFIFIHVVSADPSDYAGGDGSVDNPYQITTCAGLQEIRDSLSDHYILTQNIDCSDTVNWNEGAGFVPIGTNGNPFQGTLNGQGYEVTGLTINNPIAGDTAIFGSIGSGGVVEYVDFINVDITDPDGTAASIAYDLKSGGIVRYVSVTGSVTAASAAGMVNVIRFGGELYDSYVLNMTLVSRFESAGIALDVREDSSIARTYAVATHTAIEPFTPELQSGIANYNSGTISSSFYDITVSGDITDGFGTPKTTAEMQTASTFTGAGWDFDSVWDIDGSYPFLRTPEAPQPVEFAGGDGSSEDPYQIETCEQLQKIDENLSAYYILNNNIECGETADWNELYGFDPIANDVEEAFSGSLNGNGYEIRNLYINRSEENLVGLFGYISTEGLVSHLNIVNADVEGLDYVGILAGIVYGTIEDSATTGSVFGDDDVGGMIGSHLGFDTITNSYSEATVVGDSRVGGLVGRNNGNIYDSYATGDVSGNSEVGGLVGESSANPENTGIYTQIEILNSYATGDVLARDFDFENLDSYQLDDEYYESFGGLVGNINGTLIEDSYATGEVTGYEDIGGLVGTSGLFEYYNSEIEENAFISSTIRDSYAVGNVHGVDTVGGFVGDVYATEISGSYSTGNVFGEALSIYMDEEFYEQDFSGRVGGFAGEMDSRTDSIYNEETETSSLIKVVEAIISESYAYGNVEGNYRVGGFIGINTSGKIENAYARGSITAINESPESIGGFVGTMLVDKGAEMIHVYSTGSVGSETETLEVLGGLIGYVDIDDDITTSFWDTQISGLTVSGGGTGKTTAQMKTEATFTDAGWDFDNVWDIDSNSNDGYPMLKDHIGDQDGIDGYEAPDEDIAPQPRRRVIGYMPGSTPFSAPLVTPPSTTLGTPGICTPEQTLAQNLRSGARNGRFHPYTKAIVTEAKILQAHLNRLGFNSGPVDGILGPISDGAIKRMQTFLKTTPDGFVGPITRGLLNNSCGVQE